MARNGGGWLQLLPVAPFCPPQPDIALKKKKDKAIFKLTSHQTRQKIAQWHQRHNIALKEKIHKWENMQITAFQDGAKWTEYLHCQDWNWCITKHAGEEILLIDMWQKIIVNITVLLFNIFLFKERPFFWFLSEPCPSSSLLLAEVRWNFLLKNKWKYLGIILFCF